MISLEQIKAAHAKVKTGADFPAYIQDLIKLGITDYETFVSDGHVIYNTKEHTQLSSAPKYQPLEIAQESNPSLFKEYLKNHQQGQSDYFTFCQQSAEAGIEKWIVDTANMTCTYYDKDANEVLMERIPGGN